MTLSRALASTALAGVLAGCAAGMGGAPNKAEQNLNTGIKLYEDGTYADAAKNLQSALDGGLDKVDQVKAHKYLAFIDCVSDHEKLCREEFAKALAIDPGFTLKPAEAGHPIWGPVFVSVKSGK
jgi:Tfp pilus assembly protein PilF